MIKEKSDFANNLDEIYRDLLNIKIDANDSFKSSMDKFYEVMRKWGICQGTWSENGRAICNAEWIMCYQVFKERKLLALNMFLMMAEPPEDLIAYGQKPKEKTN
jgi:hypothetical protein